VNVGGLSPKHRRSSGQSHDTTYPALPRLVPPGLVKSCHVGPIASCLVGAGLVRIGRAQSRLSSPISSRRAPSNHVSSRLIGLVMSQHDSTRRVESWLVSQI